MARTRSLLRTKALVDELEKAENVLVSLATALDAKDHYTQRAFRARGRLRGSPGGRRSGSRATSGATCAGPGCSTTSARSASGSTTSTSPAKLTTAEYEEVKKHPVIGFEICRPLRTMAPLVDLIRGHHERLDGRGYPDGLKAEQIPIPLRCLTIADVYDALTSDRAYREAMTHDEALEVMQREASAGMWDVRIIDAFAEMLIKSGPPGHATP